MKNKQLLLPMLALLAGLFVFLACNKNARDNPGAGSLPEEKTVTASVQGRVLDESGLPVKDAAVSSGASSTTTDVNGTFSFSNISMSSRFGFVKVTKQGYFMGSRSIITDAGGSNYVTVSLLPRTAKGGFSSPSGGTIVVQTGDTVVFDASSVVTASSGAAYGGVVHVYAAYLDPTDPDLSKHMPGDLRGIGTDGKETALQTFGMMVVELEGDGGEKLQIAPGKKASITMTIPASMRATTPSSVPLWYFNDTTGRWIQQGTATRKGDLLCGQTDHFTYWNCDLPMGTVSFTVKLKDQHGNPLTYTRIQFVSQTYGTRGGMTDASGFAQGLIPKGETLQFQVLNACGAVMYEASVGLTTADQDLGTLTVNLTGANVTLQGSVVDCSNNPVASGYVNILVDGLNYRAAVAGGNFSQTILRCNVSDAQAVLTAGDYGTLQQGAATKMTVDTGTVQVGKLTACGTDFDQYFILTMGGNNYNLTVPSDSIYAYFNGGGVIVYAGTAAGVSPFESLSMSVPGLTTTGDFNTAWLALTLGINNYTQLDNGGLQVSVTHYPAVGEYLLGTISGVIKDTVNYASPVNSHQVTGSFKMKRFN